MQSFIFLGHVYSYRRTEKSSLFLFIGTRKPSEYYSFLFMNIHPASGVNYLTATVQLEKYQALWIVKIMAVMQKKKKIKWKRSLFIPSILVISSVLFDLSNLVLSVYTYLYFFVSLSRTHFSTHYNSHFVQLMILTRNTISDYVNLKRWCVARLF